MLSPSFQADEASAGQLDTQYQPLSPWLKDFLAGGIAGAAAIALTQPLDTVRVRLQQAAPLHAKPAVAVAGHAPRAPARAPAPTTALSTLRHLVRAEGVAAAWKGMAMPLAFASIQSAVVFSIYNSVVRLQSPAAGHSSSTREENQEAQETGEARQHIPTPWMGFVAGCAAGFGQVWVWSPVEMVKLRMQLQSAPRESPRYRGPLTIARQVWAREGLIGLYRGATVTALRDVPSYGMYFGFYHLFVSMLEGPNTHPDEATALTHVLAGGTAGAASWCGVYWLDVVKTRMQATTRAQTKGMTWMHFARQIWQREGSQAFSRGMPTTLARAFILDAVSFVGFRMSLKLL